MATKNIVGQLVYKVTGDSKELDTSLKGSQDRVAKFSKFMMSAIGIGGAVIAIRSLIRIGKDLVAAYSVQEQAETKLAAAIRATGGNVSELMERYKTFSSSIQDVTTVGDEQTLGLLQQAQSLGIARDKMEDATKGAIGLSKALGIDMNMALRGIALAYQGNYTALSRYIPALRTASTEAEKQAALQKAMANGFEIATAEAESGTGAMLQFKNATGDLKEIGGKLILDFLAPAIRKLTDVAKEAAGAAANMQRLRQVLQETETDAGPEKLRADMAALQAEIARVDAALKAGMPIMGMRRNEAEQYVSSLQNKLEGLRRQYIKLGGDAKTAGKDIVDPFDEAARVAREELYAALSIAERQAAALGDSFDLTKEKIALYEKAIKSLIEKGLDPSWPAMQQLIAALKELREVEGDTTPFQAHIDAINAQVEQEREAIEDLNEFRLAELARRAKAEEDARAEELEAEKELKQGIERVRQELFNFIVGLTSALSALNQEMVEREIAALEASLERNKAAIDQKYGALTQAERDYNAFLQAKEAERYANLSEEEKREYDLRVAADKAEQERLRAAEEEKAALDLEFERQKAQLEYEAALTSWRLTLVQSIASAAQAFIGALTTQPIWLGIIMAALVAGLTGVQLALINAQKPTPPSFAEGADFIVPPGYPNDSFPMQVESGEHVVVEPKGAAAEQIIHNVIYLDGRVIADFINKGSREGQVRISSRTVVRR